MAVEGVGERLRDAREKAGLTQERAAKLIKVSMRTLQRWERGMYEPPIGALRAMARHYKSTTDYFILGSRAA